MLIGDAMAKKKKKFPLWFEEADSAFENLMRMEDQIHKMMKEIWEKPLNYSFFRAMDVPAGLVHRLRPIPVDIAETDKELVARADLPGFEKDEVKVKVTENTLEISAEKKKQVVQKEKNFYRQERSYGSARRIITLPMEVKPEKVKAKFENGVLTVTMPKKEARKKYREIKPE